MQSTGRWTEVVDPNALEEALKLTKGSYQRNFLLGYENLSGSSLSGKARQWGAKYARSRRDVLKRLTDAGIKYREKTGDHGERILVIGG